MVDRVQEPAFLVLVLILWLQRTLVAVHQWAGRCPEIKIGYLVVDLELYLELEL